MSSSAQVRTTSAIATLLVIAAGLAARHWLQGWWAKNLGVCLWAVAAYSGLRMLFPGATQRTTALAALAVSWGVEVAQLTAVPRTISSLHPALRLLFGDTFGAGDLVALGVGVAAAVAAEAIIRRAG